MVKINICQKIAIIVGSTIICLMFLVFPVEISKEVKNTKYKSGLVFSKPYITETHIDYKATATRSLGVAMGVLATVFLLGLTKKKEGV